MTLLMRDQENIEKGIEKGIQQGREEGIRQGREEGKQQEREQGIRLMIESGMELCVNRNSMLAKVAEKYNLNEDQALIYMDRYWG